MTYGPFPELSIDAPSLCSVHSAVWKTGGVQTLCAHHLKSLTWTDNRMTRGWTDIRGRESHMMDPKSVRGEKKKKKNGEQLCLKNTPIIKQFVNILIACENPNLFPNV